MATALSQNRWMSAEEYLRTSYRPDCDYVDGHIEERSLGEKEHARLQVFLAFLLFSRREEWGVEVFTELRTKVASSRFRVPDLLVLRSGVHFENVLESPPYIAIEILSPEDRLSRIQDRIDDYLNFGVEHVWIFDPQRREAWRATRDGLFRATGELTVPSTPICIALNTVFAELDRP